MLLKIGIVELHFQAWLNIYQSIHNCIHCCVFSFFCGRKIGRNKDSHVKTLTNDKIYFRFLFSATITPRITRTNCFSGVKLYLISEPGISFVNTGICQIQVTLIYMLPSFHTVPVSTQKVLTRLFSTQLRTSSFSYKWTVLIVFC